MWRAPANPPDDFVITAPPFTEFGLRIFNCVVLGIAVIYGSLIVYTLSGYGAQLDKRWKVRMAELMRVTDGVS
jgi:hypothetical protein